MLHIVIGTGLLGFMMKLYKPSEANMLFDGASLVLYMCGITVYIANIVKGLRTVTAWRIEAWEARSMGRRVICVFEEVRSFCLTS